MGVDVEGNKHVLAIREGATENAAVAKESWKAWRHHLGGRGADPFGPVNQSGRRPLQMRPVAIWHVRRDRGVPVGVVIACMRIHPFAGMKNLHGVRGASSFWPATLFRKPYPLMKLLHLFACGALAM